jgi:hypothetical protein
MLSPDSVNLQNRIFNGGKIQFGSGIYLVTPPSTTAPTTIPPQPRNQNPKIFSLEVPADFGKLLVTETTLCVEYALGMLLVNLRPLRIWKKSE